MTATTRILRRLCFTILFIALFNLRLHLSHFTIGESTSLRTELTVGFHNNDPADEASYLKWLEAARHQSTNLTLEEEPIRLMYRAMNGLGHQLVRLSSAYHLAMLYRIPRVWPTENPVCGGTIFTLFTHLIGPGQLIVDIPFFGDDNLFRNQSLFPLPHGWPDLSLVNETDFHSSRIGDSQVITLKRDVNLNNEVPGYSHSKGRLWSTEGDLYENNFYGKQQTDYQMYHQLMLLFEHKHKTRIEEVLKMTKFESHTVFGLHVRSGNGESGDFQRKNRGMLDLDGWLTRAVHLFCDYRDKNSHYFTKKPLMIFVGTDTGSVIPKLHVLSKATCQIPFVSAEQAYPEEGQSVTWSKRYNDGEKCLKGWEDMFLDMYFFTRCNSVMAGTYSSFTQSAPLSFIMHKAKLQLVKGHHHRLHPNFFCDIGVDGQRMDCATTLVEWLRQTPNMTWGNLTARKQAMKHEITFPLIGVGPIGAFEGTLMMDTTKQK